MSRVSVKQQCFQSLPGGTQGCPLTAGHWQATPNDGTINRETAVSLIITIS